MKLYDQNNFAQILVLYYITVDQLWTFTKNFTKIFKKNDEK